MSPGSSRALGKHQSQSPGAPRAPRTASPATWPRGRHGKARLTRGVLRFRGGEATTPQCPESRRYYNEDPGGGPGAGGEGLGVAGGRCVRYFSPALLPNGAGSCGTVTLCPPGGPQGRRSVPGGPFTAPGTADPVLMADARRGGLRSGVCPLATRGRKVSAGPGLTTRVGRTVPDSCSWERRPCSEPLPSTTWEARGCGPGSGTGQRQLALLMARGHCRDEPFGGTWV